MDQATHARRDLAFIKAVAEDKGALPAALGWHLIAIGAIYGLDFIHIWAIFTGRASWPEALQAVPWLPGVIAYIPANIVINLRARHMAWGPTARAFGAAWAAMGLMIVPAVAVLLIGQAQAGFPFYLVWGALAFVLYGGAWAAVAIVRGGRWHWLTASGCFALALLCALLINQSAQWLVMAAGLLLLVALPGLIILRSGRAREEAFA
jgi:hypothetical protein